MWSRDWVLVSRPWFLRSGEVREFKEVMESQGRQRGSGKSQGILKVPNCKKNKRQMTNLFKVIKTYTFIVIKLIIPGI